MQITINGRTEKVNFFHTHKRGVDRIFVDHPLFLAKVDLLSFHQSMYGADSLLLI